MATEILSPDYHTSVFAHSAATTAKTFYLIGGQVWLAMNDADADADNTFVRKASKIRAPKNTGEAWAAGVTLYWDDTAKNFTTTATDNTVAGTAAEEAASADDEGKIDLNPHFKAPA